MPERVELNMGQAIFIEELPELSCYCIGGYEHTDGVNAYKVHVSFGFTRHYIQPSFEQFQVVIQGIVHSKAADAAVGFQHGLQDYFTCTSAADFTDNFVSSFRKYA